MNDIRTPIRETLQQLTHDVADRQLPPIEAYVRFRSDIHEKLGETTLRTYASSAITSGGHSRRRMIDSNLSVQDVIRSNTKTALELVDGLYESRQLYPEETVEAVALGYIPAWKQSDYMEFWLSVMAGLPFKGDGVAQKLDDFSETFENKLAISEDMELLDMDIYNSSLQSPIERQRHYFRHAEDFAKVAQATDGIAPVKQLVGLVDPETSLGAQTEKIFAHKMGIKLFRVAYARVSHELNDKVVPKSLVNDIDMIVNLGGDVLYNIATGQFVLVPTDKEARNDTL